MELKQANKGNVRMRIALHGPSGSGKTYSALQLAFGLSKTQNIAIIDTEASSAELYSHLGSFSVLTMDPPFTPERFITALTACEDHGCDVIIIDSLSHAWEGSGGILEIHGGMPGNSFANWSKVMPRHNALIQRFMHSSAHIICTLRAKQDYVIHERNGRMSPEKVGLKPVQKEGIDYEFTLALELDVHHNAKASKDRTGLFVNQPPFKVSKGTGVKIDGWCKESSELSKNIIKVFNTSSSNGHTNH
jgi:hypothetical protein